MIIDRYCLITDKYFCILLLEFFIIIKFNAVLTSTVSYTSSSIPVSLCPQKMPVYQIKRLISGTFHQGDIRFGNTAGRQCACNVLFSIFWSNIRSVSRWSSPDLDKILNEGDQLYKSLNTQNYLDIDNLPTSIVTFSGHSAVILRETIECEATLVRDFPFLSTINQFTNPESNSSKCLFFIQGYTIAIFCVKEDNVNKYFVFDSHSRDTRGLSVHDGTFVLMKFDNLHEFDKYIQVIYLEYRGVWKQLIVKFNSLI